MKAQKGRDLTRWAGITVCQLYGTTVAVLNANEDTVFLNDGGYETFSTTKAISAAFEKAETKLKINRRMGVYTLRKGQDVIYEGKLPVTLSGIL